MSTTPRHQPSEPARFYRTNVIVYAVFAVVVVILGIAFSVKGKSDPPTTTKNNDSSVSTDEKVPMPDVVCHNLQDALDEIQEAGVFFSRSEDATGRGAPRYSTATGLS
jgi:hypothetical protein